MKLTKEILLRFINEELTAAGKTAASGGEEEDPLSGELGGGQKLSTSDYAKAQAQDIAKRGEELKGIDDKERAVLRKVIGFMKTYAQEQNLAGSTEVSLINRIIKTLSKASEEDANQTN